MIDHKFYVKSNESGTLRQLLLLALLFSIPFFIYLGQLPLMDPDEGRYAEIPREMLERGDLITPTLNYVHYFEKPPLLYWVNAVSLKLFGFNEFAARLPSALCGLQTILVTYAVARRLYGKQTALIAAVILGTSAGFVIQSRIILTDMLLTFCLTASLGSFIIAAENDKADCSIFPWYFFYFFSALAVMTKGLIGLVFPAGIILLYLLHTREWVVLREMRLPSGLLLFAITAVPWFVAVSLKNPEFARFFFIHEHFERFTTTVHGRHQPFWFFIPVLAATMLPWSFFIPGAIQRAWQERRSIDGRVGIFLLIWAGLIFLFFSKSNSKLIPYILPIFPPLAILVALRIQELFESRDNKTKLTTILLGATFIILGIAGLGYHRTAALVPFLSDAIPQLANPLRQFLANAPPISFAAGIIIGALFLVQGTACLVMAGRKPLPLLVILGCCSFMLEILVPGMIMKPIAQIESPRELALKAASFARDDTRIVTSGPMQGVSWYTGRRVLVTGKLDELEFGSKQGDQSAWFPDQPAFLNLWNSSDHVLMILRKSELENLLPLLPPLQGILGKSGRLVLIGNQ